MESEEIKLLGKITFTPEFIETYKLILIRPFKDKINLFYPVRDNLWVTTRPEIPTNDPKRPVPFSERVEAALIGHDTPIHFIEWLNEKQNDIMRPFIEINEALHEEELQLMLAKSYMSTANSFFTKVFRLFRLYKMDMETSCIRYCTVDVYVNTNGEIQFRPTDELKQLFKVVGLPPRHAIHKESTHDIEQTSERQVKAVKLCGKIPPFFDIGIARSVFTILDPIAHLLENTEYLKEESSVRYLLKLDNNTIAKSSMYTLITGKKLIDLMGGIHTQNLRIPMVPGYSHPVIHVTHKANIKTEYVFWKEEDSVRMMTETEAEGTYKCVSFMPKLNFFMM